MFEFLQESFEKEKKIGFLSFLKTGKMRLVFNGVLEMMKVKQRGWFGIFL